MCSRCPKRRSHGPGPDSRRSAERSARAALNVPLGGRLRTQLVWRDNQKYGKEAWADLMLSWPWSGQQAPSRALRARPDIYHLGRCMYGGMAARLA